MYIMAKRKICVLTGAGVSQESGIKTFRDADGLWEGHDVQAVASPQGWAKDQDLVLDFYNQRRRQLKEVKPNGAHHKIAELEADNEVVVITQNVDDLHERAGSSSIIHLHGELTKVRSVVNEHLVLDWDGDIVTGDTGEDGHQLRPHIVWFGEAVPMLEHAIVEVSTADIVVIIGTSMQVYPAAGLVGYAPPLAQIYYIDPKPHISYELQSMKNLTIIEDKAVAGMDELIGKLNTQT